MNHEKRRELLLIIRNACNSQINNVSHKDADPLTIATALRDTCDLVVVMAASDAKLLKEPDGLAASHRCVASGAGEERGG